MKRVLKENDIITLKGNQKFLVYKCFDYKNESYALVVKLKENDNEEDLTCIVKEFIYEEKLLLDIIRDEKILKPILKALDKSVKEASKQLKKKKA